MIGFILFSGVIFLWVGQPVQVLIFAGGLNGLILPVALSLILIAARNKNIVRDYNHPYWMQLAGWVVVVAVGYLGIKGVINLF